MEGHDTSGGQEDESEPTGWFESFSGIRGGLHEDVGCHRIRVGLMRLDDFVQSAGACFVQYETIDQSELQPEA